MDLAKMFCFQLLLVVVALCYGYAQLSNDTRETNVPIVVTTWKFRNATVTAWDVLASGGSALDAIEKGCGQCELDQCAGTVGYGGSPDENGETTLDALIMDGNTMNVGAVGALRGIRHAASVARAVLEHTTHTLLVGDQASDFAVQMGFQREPMMTNVTESIHRRWKQANCQPNYWLDVSPDPRTQCGPYKPLKPTTRLLPSSNEITNMNHDTIGMVAIDNERRIVAGTSTNGLNHKIPGRVGDSPVPGSGAYADSSVGGAAGTGDGDIMMRFVPSFLAVEEMRRGATPSEAASTAIRRMIAHYPQFSGAVIAVSKNGDYGAACHNIPIFKNTFPYYVQRGDRSLPTEERANCLV